MNPVDLEAVILRAVRVVLEEKGSPTPRNLTAATPLVEGIDIDSLDWASIIVTLEDQLKLDPFAQGRARNLVTLGDFIELYRSRLSTS